MPGKVVHGHAVVGRSSRLYNVWRGMRQRCLNPKATGYVDYGGRGVSIHPTWDDFRRFKHWAQLHGYADALSIERRDVDGNYEPNNCYWATDTVQACNKRKRRGTKNTFIGVRFARCGKWETYINIKGKRTQLGFFEEELSAVQARDAYIRANNLPHKLNL